MTSRAAEYAVQSSHFLEKAEEALAEDDLAQASEKLWGAAAQAVKAAAESRGWSHNGHRELFDVVNRLAQEYDDPELRDLFRLANSLHINFYENWLNREYIEDGVGQVQEFVRKVQAIQV